MADGTVKVCIGYRWMHSPCASLNPVNQLIWLIPDNTLLLIYVNPELKDYNDNNNYKITLIIIIIFKNSR